MNSRHLAWCSVGLVLSTLWGWGCGNDEKPPRSREAFCRDWAKAACSKEVLSVCQAESAETCHDAQEDFCRDLIPEDFSDVMGDECIAAVKDAYKDADLKAAELATVLRLATPCDQLIVGPKEEGESCSERSDCDTSLGLECVRKAGDDAGKCEVPEEVGAGRKCDAAQKTCPVGFYCDGSNCIEAKDLADDCTIQEECGEGGFCGDDGKCAEQLELDNTCTRDLECATGICYEYQPGDKVCTDRIRLARSEPLCDALR